MSNSKYFISYARKDSQTVLELVKLLKIQEAPLWMDQDDIGAGELWDEAIKNALSNCEGVVVALSPQSVRSEEVLKEVEFALEKEKPVIPILIEETKIPSILQRFEYIDFTTHRAEAISKIFKALKIEPRGSMGKIFISYSLDENGLAFTELVQQIVYSYSLVVLAGVRSPQNYLTKERNKQLADCDAIICIVSENPKIENLNWIQSDLEHFDAKGKRNILTVFKDVDDHDILQKRKKITYDPNKPIPSIIPLSQEIALWKHDAGKIIEVFLAVDEATGFLMQRIDIAKVYYRLWTDDRKTNWVETWPIFRPGGIFVYLNGVFNETLIEVKIDDGETTWKSEVVHQTVHVNLRKEDS